MRIDKFLSLALMVAHQIMLCWVSATIHRAANPRRRRALRDANSGIYCMQMCEALAPGLSPRRAKQSRCAHKRLRINLCFQKDSVLPRQLKTDHKLRACVVRRAKVPHAHTPLWNKHTKGGRVGERYWIAGGADLETFSPRAAERWTLIQFTRRCDSFSLLQFFTLLTQLLTHIVKTVETKFKTN
jgi:hypothetical protein